MPGARVASGERVTLRTAESEDVPFLSRAWANPDLRHPLHGGDVRNQAQLEEEFDVHFGDDGDELYIVSVDDDAGPGPTDADAIRRIGLVRIGGPDGSRGRSVLAFYIVPKAQREGYATEAVSLAIDYVFRSDAHPAIEAGAFAHNDASRGLLESLGFTQEGRERKALFLDGSYRDRIRYSLLREEWNDQT